MGILAAIKSLPMLIALGALAALGIYAGAEHHAKIAAQARVEQVSRDLGAAEARTNQWRGAADGCSKATEQLAAKLAGKQSELDQVTAQKAKVVIEREAEGHQLIAGADRSKSCEQAVADFILTFQAPANLQTSAKPGERIQ